MNETATEALAKHAEARQQTALHQRLNWFFEKHAPDDKRPAAEFHSDFMMVVQEVHRDAGRATQATLENALRAMPAQPIFMAKD